MKLLTLILATASLLVSCKEANNENSNQQQSVIEENKTIPTTDCRNCGMPSKEYPKWNVKWKQENTESYFCSPRCMFMQVTSPKSNIKTQDSLLVVDYYSQKFITAQNAFFVINSDITGPMGHDFVPFADQIAAKDFLQEHKGSAILTFKDVKASTITELGK